MASERADDPIFGATATADAAGETGRDLHRLLSGGAAGGLPESILEGLALEPSADGSGFRLDGALAAVRHLPFLTTRVADSLPAWSAGLLAERSMGPAVDRLGRPIWIDLFRRVRQLRFVRSAGAAPFLTVPIAQARLALAAAPLRAGKPLKLSAGSLWFASGLVSAAPSGTYTGLRIAAGKMVFSADIALGTDEIVVPPGVTVDLRLDLAPPAAAAAKAGSEFAAARAVFPKGLDLGVSAGGATLSVRGDASVEAWGAEIALSPASGAPLYRADLNRLVVPMTPLPSELSIGAVVSTHFMPSGTAPIALAGLALPVAAIAAADLGEAAGVGALMLETGPGLAARWADEPRPAALGPSVLLLDAARLAFTGWQARALGAERRVWLRTGPDGDLVLIRRDGAPVSYFTGPDGAESVLAQATAEARLPRPVTVAGDRVALRLPQANAVWTRAADGAGTLTVAGLAAPPAPGDRPLAFGLTNAVLRASQPFGAFLTGRFENDALAEGTALVGHRLRGMLPSLPDPYAASLPLDRRFGAADRGVLVSDLRWGAAPALAFHLPSSAIFEGVDAPVSDARPAAGLQAGTAAAAAAPFAADRTGDLLDFEMQPKVVLLDVSTAASRLGLALRPPTRDRETGGTAPLKPLAVAGLDLAADGRFVTLLMLPSVQWEPVRALPGPEPFPEEVRFLNSGVPTVIDVPGVELVPLTPLAAYRTVLENFETPATRPSRARFTLPFGMVAAARLGSSTSGRGARVGEARPAAPDGMEGAHQIRIDAADPSLGPGETPALPGATFQFPVAVPVGGGAPVSILGTSVTAIFNGVVGPAGADPMVPVTRVDLAGHGASLLSAWANPEDPETGVAKAEFKVLNGRAAHEVVQVKSILLPYWVPVVRTITMERRGSALVTREDSGWVAVRDGDYRAGPGSGIVTHPGCVRRATRVGNIRETGISASAGGHDFVAVRFDTDLVLDGAAAPVPARRQEGWVKLSIPPLTAPAYAALIGKVGPMGGAVDATIAVGGGRHRMRLHRVGVGVAGPEFAMAAWGSLLFPEGGGDWSVLEAADGAEAPAPVAEDRGLPLIRQGAAGLPTAAPWRFADPEDLLDPASPGRDYGILHGMGTQRAFFRRPRIEAARLDRIVSTEQPVIADPLVLATATGPFPRQADAIPFPSETFALEARADGTWRLDGSGTFPVTVPRRTIRTAGTVRSDLDYAGATLTYAVDTAQPVAWRFGLQGARKIMAHTAMGDLMTMEAAIDAKAGRATAFADPKLKLGGPFDIVQDLLTIMQDLGVPARPDVRMTNEWSLKIGLTVPFVDAAGEDFEVIPGEPVPTIKFADTGAKLEIAVAPDADSAKFEIGGSPMFAIKSIPGLYVVAIVKFSIQLSTESGTTYGVLIGVGVAYELEAGPFELKGLFALTFFAVFGDTVLGYGIGFLVKVGVELAVVEIEVSLEGKLARLVAQTGTPNETVFQIAKLVFAIEVSVFMVFSISLEVETKKVEVIRGPLLESDAPDVL
ncbi:MAG: hypothetical protein INR68_07055 [Methylobacterium mesophilicum]|nr:hypothetical protein [Methylobacterium mesophilicum]